MIWLLDNASLGSSAVLVVTSIGFVLSRAPVKESSDEYRAKEDIFSDQLYPPRPISVERSGFRACF